MFQAISRFGLLLATTSMVFLSGCAVGNVYDFSYIPPDHTPPKLSPKVVLLFEVEDLRRDILEGDEPASWVGEQRGGYGNPFTVKTADGRAFAEVVQGAIRRDLEAVGLKVEEAGRAPNSAETVAEKIGSEKADAGLRVKMLVYNSNTYLNTDMEWDFQLMVFDAAGKTLYDEHVEGRQTLEGSFWNSPKAAKANVPPAFYEVLHDMIVGNPDLLAALGSSAVEDPEATAKCSVDQILSMKESGLSPAQIRAACGESGS